MRNRRVLVLLFSVAIPVALAAAGGAAYGFSRSAVTSANTDVVRKTKSATSLSPTGGTKTTILSVNLPAGSWVITADVTAIGNSNTDWARCGIFKGATRLSLHSGDFSPAPGTYSADLGTIGAVHGAGAFTASLKCWEDGSSGPPAYIDAGAVLWAHRSASLSQ